MRPKYVVYGLAVVALVFVVTLVNGVKDFWFDRGEDATEQEIVVAEGETLSSLLPQLQEELGVRAFWLRVYSNLFDNVALHPGTYWIPKNASYAALVQKLETTTTSEVILTVPEGYSLAQIGDRVREVFPEIDESEWDRVTGMSSSLEMHPFVLAAKKPANVDLEGYLFPDTYRFFEDATAEDIVNTMLDEMQEKYESIGVAPRAGYSVHEVLTLASIVEKEVRQPETRATVAGIFWNRLEIGMPLQSDATINYIIGGDDPSPTLADLEVESLYNTYQHPGLPPGPISSPGLVALTATLQPTETDYFYFLTTDAGEIYYAETHDEHVLNKQRYLY